MSRWKRAAPLAKIQNLPAWALVIAGIEWSGHLHLAKFLLESGASMKEFAEVHWWLVVFIGFLWIGVAIFWPDIRAAIPTIISPTSEERIGHIESHIFNDLTGRIPKEPKINAAFGRLAVLETGAGEVTTTVSGLGRSISAMIPLLRSTSEDLIKLTSQFDVFSFDAGDRVKTIERAISGMQSWQRASAQPAISEFPQFVVLSSRLASLMSEASHLLEIGTQIYTLDPTTAGYKLETEYLSNAPHMPRDMYAIADSLRSHIQRCRAINVYRNDVLTKETRVLLGYANDGSMADLSFHQTLLILQGHRERLEWLLGHYAATFLTDGTAKETTS